MQVVLEKIKEKLPGYCVNTLNPYWLVVGQFQSWSCSWLPRRDDDLAHNLARLGAVLGDHKLCILEESIIESVSLTILLASQGSISPISFHENDLNFAVY